MLKKALLIFLLLGCLGAFAQSADWYKYPIFNGTIDQMIATPHKVYYTSSGNLFSYNVDDNESYTYSSINSLSEENINKIFYNSEKGYLLVAYESSNIDLLYDNGRVVNLPDIKHAVLTSDKGINDVAFGSDRIVVATNFGIVVFSDVRYEVIESGIYNAVINTVAVMHDHILVYGHYATSFSVLASPLSARHNSLDKFQKVGSWAMVSIDVIDDDHIAFIENITNKLGIRKINFDNYSWSVVDTKGEYICKASFSSNKDGLYTFTDRMIVHPTPVGVEAYELPQMLQGQLISVKGSLKNVWAANADGIAEYDITGASPTVLHDKMLIDGYITTSQPGVLRWSPDGQRLYVSNHQNSVYKPSAKGEGSSAYQSTCIVEGMRTRDVSLLKASAEHHHAINWQAKLNSTRMFGDPNWLVEDPDDPDKYYCNSYFEGVYVIKRNPQTGVYEEIGKFTEQNAPITPNWGQRVGNIRIDSEGNLWLGCQHGSIIHILPAEKRRLDPKSIKRDDWKTMSKLEKLDYSGRDFQLLICRKSNMVFFSMASYENGFVAVDTKGTYLNTNDDTVMHWDRLVDQDGNMVIYQYITCFLEDARGCVWVGTMQGVFEISRPEHATDPAMTIRRIKVPRNDGTNYADYLLDSEVITHMALDPAGRKWIGTASSGLYLVSETGDEIIRHYDSSNSPMASNEVLCVECDPMDNTVYVGTPVGLYSFKSDAAPGKADYSEIYAYPNPVRPEYSDYVTITGLMDNSVVKITDAMGNVVYETRSEGGMASWDVCARSGERVPSGVYYVYASEHNSGNTAGAVTKILVIN